eukprot:scaffold508_cov554-Prasinococcus_capsulatus_cf.AAC.22
MSVSSRCQQYNRRRVHPTAAAGDSPLPCETAGKQKKRSVQDTHPPSLSFDSQDRCTPVRSVYLRFEQTT